MPRTIKVRIDYEIEVHDKSHVPSREELEDRIKEQVLTYGISYRENRFWYVDPDYVVVRVKKKWYESLFG